jgi:hypothetical protein
MVSRFEPPYFFSIEALNKEIIDIASRICIEESVLIEQREGKSFEALIKTFDKFFAHVLILPPCEIPFEDIAGAIDLIINHIFVIAPYAGFYEMDFHFLLALEFYAEPDVVSI